MEKIISYCKMYNHILHELVCKHDIDIDDWIPISNNNSVNGLLLNNVYGNDSYGVDYRGERALVKLFETDNKEYFSAFWVGIDTNYKDSLDTYPIYSIDLDDNIAFGSVGNFKNYMECILERVSTLEPHNKKLNAILLLAKQDLCKFSSKCINKGLYSVMYTNNLKQPKRLT